MERGRLGGGCSSEDGDVLDPADGGEFPVGQPPFDHFPGGGLDGQPAFGAALVVGDGRELHAIPSGCGSKI
jgi:hypothetical protein